MTHRYLNSVSCEKVVKLIQSDTDAELFEQLLRLLLSQSETDCATCNSDDYTLDFKLWLLKLSEIDKFCFVYRFVCNDVKIKLTKVLKELETNENSPLAVYFV